MAQRLGTALLVAMRRRETPSSVGAKESALLSPPRVRLFQFFCLHPLAVPTEAARATGMAAGTLRWHGAKLVEDRWLRLKGATYFPSGLVDPQDLPLFGVVSTCAARRTLAAVFAFGGQSVSDLSRTVGASRQATTRFLDDFRFAGLVSVVEDGAFARAYPTPLLAGRREANGRRAGAFCDEVLRRLVNTGLAPEVLRRTASEFLLRAGPPGRRIALDLPIDPFSSALIE